jgi:hypothetical protein
MDTVRTILSRRVGRSFRVDQFRSPRKGDATRGQVPTFEPSRAVRACQTTRVVPSALRLRSFPESLVELNTTPVGAPPGIFTTSGTITGMLPLTPPLSSVETSAPLSATHSGVVGPAAWPQGLTRFESVIRATPAMSEIRFVC